MPHSLRLRSNLNWRDSGNRTRIAPRAAKSRQTRMSSTIDLLNSLRKSGGDVTLTELLPGTPTLPGGPHSGCLRS